MSLFKKNLPATQNSWLSLQNEMNDLFEAFNRNAFKGFSQEGFMPKLELKEDEKTYKVSAELPGLKEEDIHLTLKDNCLIIEGEKKAESKNEDKGIVRSEFSYGSFYRTFPFSTEVNPEKVSANYKDGILQVIVEKAEASGKSRKITIKKD